MTEVVNQGWKLQSLVISKEWNSDTYNGKIRFVDNKNQELSFNIPQDKMDQMISLVADSILDSARELGQGLVKSVKAQLPPPLPAVDGGNFPG